MPARAAARTGRRTTPARQRTRRDIRPPPRSHVNPSTPAWRPGMRDHQRPRLITPLYVRLAPALDFITAEAVSACTGMVVPRCAVRGHSAGGLTATTNG